MQEVTNPKSTLSLPREWIYNYVLKRIGEEDKYIREETRNYILKSMQNGATFVQIGNYTIMVNTIKAIEPRYGEKNIPPRPNVSVSRMIELKQTHAEYEDIENEEDVKLQKLWDKTYADSKQPLLK